MQIQDNVREHLAAIVDGSDDAIVTKTLDSVIRSWNPAAEDLFGYSAEEAIGRPIHMLLPEDRLAEEDDVIARLRRGERIRHFETVRRRKDGTLVPVSLTISPVRNEAGQIVAASKIARDISLQQLAAEQQKTALAEMMHRVRNCFAVASGLVGVCAREARTSGELASMLRERFAALAAVQSLAIPDPSSTAQESTTLWTMLATLMKPFVGGAMPEFQGSDAPVGHNAITPLALVFYELCTNSVKYGALGSEAGVLTISAHRENERLIVRWRESMVGAADEGSEPGDGGGFGTRLCEAAVGGSLGGRFTRNIAAEGISAEIDLDAAKLAGS